VSLWPVSQPASHPSGESEEKKRKKEKKTTFVNFAPIVVSRKSNAN